MMYLGRIAAVSYLNTVPMIYGIEHADHMRADLLLSPPSQCASAFSRGEADIALVPVGSLHLFTDYRIVTSHCIGAVKDVRTVVMMTNTPLNEIRRVYLDSHSMTSVLLLKMICELQWNITPQWADLEDYSGVDNCVHGDAFLLIGDKVFGYEGMFSYSYDLARCWREWSGLPFVFAVWIARNSVDQAVVDQLDAALNYGTHHVADAIEYYGYGNKSYAFDYLTNNIDFVFDEQKKKALSLFWNEGRKFCPPINPG